MEKLHFVFVIFLGSVLYSVAEESSTQPEWDNRQFLNQMQRWFDSYQQQTASANENAEIGDQTAANPMIQLVSDVAQGLAPFIDNETNSYDLREAMQYLNASNGFPTVQDNNTSHNGSDEQIAAFSAMFNAAANALFKPDSIPNYLNLLHNASVNPSVASDDTITSDALSKQFEKEYEMFMSRFTEALHSNKTSDTKGVSQNHINDVVTNINNQLSQMLKWPENENRSSIFSNI